MDQELDLPDCDRSLEAEVYLSRDDKRELIGRMAERGLQGLDDFIQERQDSHASIARAIEEMRGLVNRQQAQYVMAVQEKYAQAQNAEVVKVRSQQEDFARERKEVRKERKRMKNETSFSLVQLAEGDEVIALVVDGLAAEPKRPNVVVRIWRAILSFIGAIFAALGRFFAWLFRRGKKKQKGRRSGKRPKGRATIGIGGRGGLLVDGDLGLDSDQVHWSPTLERQLTEDLPQGFWSKFRRQLQKTFRREQYEELLYQLMLEQVNRAQDSKNAELKRHKAELAAKLKELKSQKDMSKNELDQALARLEQAKQDEIDRLQNKLGGEPVEEMRRRLMDELADSGLMVKMGEEWLITNRLIHKFAEIVFDQEMRLLPAAYHVTYGASEHSEGIYERDQLRTVHEISRMDLVESVLNARTRFPGAIKLYDDDLYVNRERKGAVNHVVIMFDKSGSMEENNRLQAAKRAVLALFKAVKGQNDRNVVDLVAFDTSVKVVELSTAWDAEARGFTNHGGAIAVARELILKTRADRRLIYLVTDGLPEAYTNKLGKDVASDPDTCLDYAVAQARTLKEMKATKLIMIMLEPEEDMFVEAARSITNAAGGVLITTDPNHLAREMLMDFDLGDVPT